MGKYPFTLQLIHQEMLTPRVIQLTFTRTDNLPLDYISGQFITLFVPNEKGKRVPRSYSLAGTPGDTITIAVAPIDGGLATRYLFHLTIGATLPCIGPQGRLTLSASDKPSHYLLVATGTGVAPFHAMLASLADRLEQDQELRITLLLGVRYKHDLLYESYFVALAKKYPRFHFRAYLSKEVEPFAENYYYSGHVQDAFEMLCLNPMMDLVYLCGNPYMIDESKAKLYTLGFSPQRIKQEKYFPAKKTLFQEQICNL